MLRLGFLPFFFVGSLALPGRAATVTTLAQTGDAGRPDVVPHAYGDQALAAVLSERG